MSESHLPFHPETRSVVEGFDPTLSVMAARPPIYPVSTYVFPNAETAAHWFDVLLGRTQVVPGEVVGLVYARLNNPNAEMFEDALKAVDKGAVGAASFSSGMAAITTTILALAKPGTTILYQRPVYGGTDHFLNHLLTEWKVNIVDVAPDEQSWRGALDAHRNDVSLVYIETPGNPTLRMTDLRLLSGLIKETVTDRRVPLVVDNTFLGPVFQQVLKHGADVAVYSATKFLGGHSDLVAGAITSSDPELVQRIKGHRAFLGTICEAFTAWMLQRSMATLHLRMIKQSKNAAKLIDVLKANPAIERIHYPTMLVGEQSRIYQQQCTAPGSMIALDIIGGRPAAFRFLNALQLIRLAVSLGGVESLACHPASTTASELSEDERRSAGISEGLVRLSIGVEYWRDILEDIEQALVASHG